MSDGTHGQVGHNIGEINSKRLVTLVERIERLEEEVKEKREDVKDVYTEAGSAGFDKKILRQVIKLRGMDAEKRQEADHLMDLYRRAVGLD